MFSDFGLESFITGGAKAFSESFDKEGSEIDFSTRFEETFFEVERISTQKLRSSLLLKSILFSIMLLSFFNFVLKFY
jgi:hypothetical protein